MSENINLLNSSNWFDEYLMDITSQSGEDGIINKIFEIIPNTNKWCCEFGAWDGKKYSNTFQLLSKKGWSGVLIEADSQKFKSLGETFPDNKKITFINKYVSFSGNDTLDKILETTKIPQNFDLLSIDIDGNDYHVWNSVNKYTPKVVVIEFNPSIPNHVEFVQKADFSINHGNSALSLVKLAKSKGYELVAVTDLNLFFVKSHLFDLFKIQDNTLQNLRPKTPFVTDFFQLYDGTIVLSGCKKMLWHMLPIKETKLQIVPWYLRVFPGIMDPFRFALLRILRRIWTKK